MPWGAKALIRCTASISIPNGDPDWKWERVLPHCPILTGRTILDVGCGSGYHMWRMIAGAHLAVGIDPTQLFLCQFEAVRSCSVTTSGHLAAAGIEQLPALEASTPCFDGRVHHRRSPLTICS